MAPDSQPTSARKRLHRIVRDQLQETGAPIGGHDVLVLVSGGIDSVVLAHVLANIRAPHRPKRLGLLYVDHGVIDATGPRQVVTDLASSLRRELHCAAVPGALLASIGNATGEAALRDFRYETAIRIAQKHAYEVACTAHHADDQIETVLFRLVSTSGAQALTGIPSVGDRGGLTVARPLLGATRQDIRAYAAEQCLAWSEDPTNANVDIARNRLRANIVPELHQLVPAAGSNLRRNIDQLAERSRVSTELADTIVANHDDDGLDADLVAALSPATGRELIAAWLRRQGLGRSLTTTVVSSVHDLAVGEAEGTNPAPITVAGNRITAEKGRILTRTEPKQSPRAPQELVTT